MLNLDTMSSWIPCEDCRISEDENDHGWYAICSECQSSRWDSLGPMFRDRAYRADLARRVLRFPNYSAYPEDPDCHASVDLNSLSDEQLQPYSKIINFVSNLFERREDDRSVTALEIFVGQYEVDEIEYCEHCTSEAENDLKRNPMVNLCHACLSMRNDHIQQTFGQFTDFFEPWDSQKSPNRVRGEELVSGHAALGYDELLHFTVGQRGGGLSTVELLATIGAGIAGLGLVVGGWNAYYNRQMYEETVRNNRRLKEVAEANAHKNDENKVLTQMFETRIKTLEDVETRIKKLEDANKDLQGRVKELEEARAAGWNAALPPDDQGSGPEQLERDDDPQENSNNSSYRPAE